MKQSIVVLAVLCAVACTWPNPPLTPALKEFASERNLAIFAPVQGASAEAWTLEMKSVGYLKLPRSPFVQELSPEGSCIAWMTLDGMRGGGPLFVTRPQGGTAEVHYDATDASIIAPSAHCDHLALKAADRGHHLHLLLVGASDNRQDDLTQYLLGFPLNKLVRMQLSSDGSKLALGAEDSFLVLDIPSGHILTQDAGRYASLSPDGRTVAYVYGGRLWLLSLDSGSKRTLLADYEAVEAGPWAPDGRFLLVGVARMKPPSPERMAVADVAGNSYLPIMDIGDPELGPSSYRWIERTLLVP